MGIFNVFNKKQRVSLVKKSSESALNLPPLPPPPQEGLPKKFPDFPKYDPGHDRSPNLPSFREITPKKPDVPKPPKVEFVQDIKRFEDKFPDILPSSPTPPPKKIEPFISNIETEKKQEVFINKPTTFVEQKDVKAIDKLSKGLSYVDINEYRIVLKNIVDIKKSLSGMDVAIKKTHDLKTKEESTYRSWCKTLNDMRKRFLFIDTSLFEKG